MFVELRVFAVHLVARGELDAAPQRVVEGVAVTVGQVAVGIGVTRVPVEAAVRPHIFARQLRVVSGAAAIVILALDFVVALCVDAGAGGEAFFAELVENVFPLVASRAA